MDYYTRDIKKSDLDDIHEYMTKPEVSKYQTCGVTSYEETKNYIDEMLNRDEHCMFNVIVDADIDKVIGSIQLEHDMNNRSGEIEFVIHPDYWGNGIATDVANTMIKYGFKVLKLNRIWAQTHINNTASEIVLQKLDMKHEGILRQNVLLDDEYRDTLLYSILKEEF